MEETSDVTELLRAWKGGDDGALERLIPTVYRELRAIAAQHLQDERAGHTLQTRLAQSRGDHPERVRTLAEELQHDARAGGFGRIARLAGELLLPLSPGDPDQQMEQKKGHREAP